MGKIRVPKKWVLEDDGYRVETINGKKHEYGFKNVFISDPEDPSFMIPWRITKTTEKEDMFIAELIRSAPEMYHKLKKKDDKDDDKETEAS